MITDPFIALSTAAAVTERITLGTAVVQVRLYQQVDLSHRILSLQQVCGDRLILGVGAGSTPHDFKAFGRQYESRFRDFQRDMTRLRELLKTGKSGGINLSPWPGVISGPPIFLGSWGKGVKNAAESFDGWIASAQHADVDAIVRAHKAYRQYGGKRAIVSTIQLSAKTATDKLKDKLLSFQDAGFDDAVVMFLPGAPKAETIKAMID